MKVEKTALPGVIVLTPTIYHDHRGYFLETYRSEELLGKKLSFVQGNFSNSVPHTLRGLHYQLKNPQGKLVMCMRGSIYDVAVDLRRDSSTFGKWVGVHLNAITHQAVYIPPGFAHGFLAGPEGASVSYECTTTYDDASSRGILWNDPTLNIGWQLSTHLGNVINPVLSAKDISAAAFVDAEVFVDAAEISNTPREP